jgi:hypothetical protein
MISEGIGICGLLGQRLEPPQFTALRADHLHKLSETLMNNKRPSGFGSGLSSVFLARISFFHFIVALLHKRGGGEGFGRIEV